MTRFTGLAHDKVAATRNLHARQLGAFPCGKIQQVVSYYETDGLRKTHISTYLHLKISTNWRKRLGFYKQSHKKE